MENFNFLLQIAATPINNAFNKIGGKYLGIYKTLYFAID